MDQAHTYILAAFVALVLGAGAIFLQHQSATRGNVPIKIGIITDLTGPAAYWGESTQAGAELALQDLKGKRYAVELIYEDYQLDPAKGASGAQKITTIDKVDAAYVELNPGTVSAAPIIRSANIPMIYNAAIVSPLLVSKKFFKSYLDYEVGCEALAKKFKDEGVVRIGTLKLNLENAELCLRGIQKIYPDPVVESYNLGDSDFRTQLLKLHSANIQALIHVGFPGDINNALQIIQNQNYKLKYGTVDDSLTPEIKARFTKELKGAWTFGFKNESDAFIKRIDAFTGNKKLSTYFAAAEAYTHITQLVESIVACQKDVECSVEHIAASPPVLTADFYDSRIGSRNLR